MKNIKQQINKVSLEVKENYTDEFILLGVLSCASKHDYKLQRMQIMKLVQKLKHRLQEEFEFEGYHKEFVKDRHGDFNPHIYPQLTNLKQSDFINSIGNEPYEKFYATELGMEVFERVKMNTGSENEKLFSIKDIIEKIIKKEGYKSSGELRKENHLRVFEKNGKEINMDDLPNGEITTPNLQDGDNFVFNNRLAIDWSLYKKIAKRKREAVTPDDEIPETQEDIFKMLGLED